MWGTEEEPFELWAVFITAIPAVGLTILGFLDQNLTSLLINRSANKLKKPPAYHLDLLAYALCVYPLCGFLGLPFTHLATVRSVTHVRALTETSMQLVNKDDPNSGMREAPDRVVEQRLSNLGIHVLRPVVSASSTACAVPAVPSATSATRDTSGSAGVVAALGTALDAACAAAVARS